MKLNATITDLRVSLEWDETGSVNALSVDELIDIPVRCVTCSRLFTVKAPADFFSDEGIRLTCKTCIIEGIKKRI